MEGLVRLIGDDRAEPLAAAEIVDAVHQGLPERSARNVPVLLHVLAWPLEWVNGAPLDADFVAMEVQALRETVAPELFAGFDPATFPSTSVPALALAAAAYERSPELGDHCCGHQEERR